MATFSVPEFDQSFLPVTDINSVDEAIVHQIMQRDTAEVSEELRTSVKNIIDSVRTGGDKTVLELTEKYDRVKLESFKVSEEEWHQADSQVDSKLKDAFKSAYENIFTFHKAMLPTEKSIEREGNTLGTIYRPVESVALYVPGGKALYPSTVLMGTVPAHLAGVKRIALLNPPNSEGKVPPVVLWCAKLAGVTKSIKSEGPKRLQPFLMGQKQFSQWIWLLGLAMLM